MHVVLYVGLVYVGPTKRALKTHRSEHKTANWTKHGRCCCLKLRRGQPRLCSIFTVLLESVSASTHCCFTLWTQQRPVALKKNRVCHASYDLSHLTDECFWTFIPVTQRSVFCRLLMFYLLALINYFTCNVSHIYHSWDVLVFVLILFLTFVKVEMRSLAHR